MGACDGMVALVTGASQGGTGTSLSTRLAAEGAKVAITARSEDGLRETLARIEQVGGQGLMLPCDLGDPNGGRATLVERTERAFGPIDILVNNAVSHGVKLMHEWTLPELEQDAQVNLWAPWLLMGQVIPGMKERKRGWILNLSSFSAELPPGPPFAVKAKNGSSLYGAMKASINRMSVAAAGELHGSGVAVNTLAPQRSVLTPATAASTLFTNKKICEPLETMVEAALALCTGDPNVLTGRLAYSLQLLVELQRPVYDLTGETLVEGWQPQDLPAAIHYREDYTARDLWPDCYNFHRPHTPYPEALKRG
jgi:NAD(P)-dependent dehydrogenase (short-subunit alcohol dehydrogenase family)